MYSYNRYIIDEVITAFVQSFSVPRKLITSRSDNHFKRTTVASKVPGTYNPFLALRGFSRTPKDNLTQVDRIALKSLIDNDNTVTGTLESAYPLHSCSMDLHD